MEGPQLLVHPNGSSDSITVNNSNNNSYNNNKNTTSGGISVGKGKLLIQLKSIVIKNLPSLRYVYGIVRIYAALPTIAGDMLVPIQGLLEVESNTMTLLSTPQKTQFIAVSAGSAQNTTKNTVDALLMNHTALHEDIRKKHDERMQAHAGDVNTTVYDVHDLYGKSFVNSTGNVTAMDVQRSKNRRRAKNTWQHCGCICIQF